METHFAGFLFSKKLEKRTLWLKLLLKQYPSFTTLWSCLFIFTLNLLTQIHIWQLFVQYSSLYVIYVFHNLTKKSAKSLESIKFCRYNLRNLARFFWELTLFVIEYYLEYLSCIFLLDHLNSTLNRLADSEKSTIERCKNERYSQTCFSNSI